jgi:hypothetical protein
MTIKQNMREAAEKLAEGQIDPNSTVASDLFQEIVERVLRRTVPQA